VGTERHCRLSGVITADRTLTADRLWQLEGAVFIGEDTGANGNGGDPAVLTIQPGTRIYGATPQSALIISRGSRIEAAGERFNPIIMTSAEDLGYADELGRTGRAPWTGAVNEDPHTGEWGGLILNGRAPINNGTAVAGGGLEREGEVGSGLFGGTNPTDNSGTLKFVQVRYPGYRLDGENELNGIAFQGVGSGTTVEYVHVHASSDDAFEWFGGTVNARYLVATNTGDDSFDWTDGWRGKVQFAVAVQANSNAETGADSRGIEADNLGANPDATPRSAPKMANVTLVGVSNGDTGAVLRRGTAGEFYNVVVSGWPDAGLDIDTAQTYAQANAGNLLLRSWLISGETNGAPLETEADGGDADTTLPTLFQAGANNRIGPTSLQPAFGGASYVNGAFEQSVQPADLSGDSFFVQNVPFTGAVNSTTFSATSDLPDHLQNWTQGFTFLMSDPSSEPPAPTCPAGATRTGDTCIIPAGVYRDDMTFFTGLEYQLDGVVFIGEDTGAAGTAGDAATLTIQPGVTVRGIQGSGTTYSALIVSRGSRLLANGTAEQPITFAPVGLDFTNAANLNAYGGAAAPVWGGLVINGRAPINNGTAAAGGGLEREGEAGSGLFGGSAADDSSGVLRYVRVLNAGYRFDGENELNGIAFQGVGRGTVVEYLQVHNSQDDGIEWFGGTVDVRNLVVTGAGDDSLDWTDGWQGRVQYAVVVQNALNTETGGDSRGIEADNLGANPDATPRSAPIMSNVTLVGATNGDSGIILRRGTAGGYYNFVVTGFPDAQLDIDTAATYQQITGGNLVLSSMLLGTAAGAPLETDADGGDADTNLPTIFQNGANNVITAATLTAPVANGKAFINGTAEAAVAPTNVSQVNSFFTAPTHTGAVSGTNANWTAGWTVWLNAANPQ